MTSRERFLKVLKGETPDRVPVALFMADQGHFITQIYPDIDPWDYDANIDKIIEFSKEMGADVFLRVLYSVYGSIYDSLHVHYGGVDVSQQAENWEVETTEYQRGNSKVYHSVIRTPEGNLEQEFSINNLRPGTYMYACTKHPVTDEKTLDIVMKYEPPMPEAFPKRAKKKISELKQKVGDDGIIGTWAPHGPFNNASLVVSLSELYSLFHTDPEFYEKLMNWSNKRFREYAKALVAAGPDIMHIGGNVPGGFLGKKTYDTYILPYEREHVEVCQAPGVYGMYHNCGEIMNLVESYINLGINIVEPFSPKHLGDADLAKAKEMVDNRYVMLGGVDQVNILQNGTPEQVIEATKRTVEIGKPRGKFILQSADFLEYGTPVENLEVFVKTGIEHGKY